MTNTDKVWLTYDDVLLVPAYSNIKSRELVNLNTLVSRRYSTLNPFVASPMNTICEEEMAFKMFELGGVGCVHRFMAKERQSEIVKSLNRRIYGDNGDGPFQDWGIQYGNWLSEIDKVPIMAAIGVSNEDRTRAKLLTAVGANILVIDVAHGHHQNVIDMIKWCKDNLPNHVDIIAGNIATPEAARDLEYAGADGLRTGIGGGSVCTTRTQTGFGLPMLTTLLNISNSGVKIPIMADGGIRTSGDIAKALAFGASSVMLGSILSGTDETPGEIYEGEFGKFKRYSGSASDVVKRENGQDVRNIEGISVRVPYKGSVSSIISGLKDGLRSALSYNGSTNISNFHPNWVKITNAGLAESHPHILRNYE